jgi:ankyrin repeat protein
MILLENGANPNVMDSGSNTVLHYSVCSEQTSIVGKLLAHKANIESQAKLFIIQDYFQNI